MPDEELTALVQGLPAELFSEIYDLTFTASSDQSREIDKQYSPPHLLQINQKSRALFATSYYGNDSVFYVPHELLEKFLGSLPKAHCAQIAHIRVLDEPPYFTDNPGITVLVQTAFALSLCGLAPDIPGYPTFEKDVFNVKVERRDGTFEWRKLSELVR